MPNGIFFKILYKLIKNNLNNNSFKNILYSNSYILMVTIKEVIFNKINN